MNGIPTRARKDTKNFACRMDASIFDKLEAYAGMARQSKTAVVELALAEYMAAHYDAMSAAMHGKQGGKAGK